MGQFPHIFLFPVATFTTVAEELEVIAADALEPLGFELVEYRRGGTRTRPLLDVRIDRLDGEPVGVDDCARASRAIEARLDGSGLVPERYVLEVSSPGVERALKTPAHWHRFVGRQVRAKGSALDGGGEFTLAAVEGDSGSEEAVLVDGKGVEHRVPLSGISEARLSFHWKR